MQALPGSMIELRESAFDFRDYLDGKPISSGDQLMLWNDGRWVFARYELASHRRREVVLESVDGVRGLDRATMRFRWPTQDD